MISDKEELIEGGKYLLSLTPLKHKSVFTVNEGCF